MTSSAGLNSEFREPIHEWFCSSLVSVCSLGGMLNVTFWADDVEATALELKAKGVEFVMEPKKQHYGTTSIFKDVDGNAIVLSSK
jgi:predicted enzyme related to lactoylglutathione lyase